MTDDEHDRMRAASLRAQAAMIDIGRIIRKTAADLEHMVDLWYAPYEAARAAAHFEGRTPPSPDVFFAGYDGDGTQS